MKRAALLFVLLVACTGDVGTVQLSIVTAPDSAVMDDVARARLTLTDPRQVVETERGPDGQLDLDLDVVAEGQTGTVTFEGFDDADELVAFGRSGPLPIAAIDADVAIYVAAPRTLAEAPVSLETPRTDIGATTLDFGVLLAGGRDAAGAPTDDLVIYNVYTHDFQIGEPLPAPRAVPTAITGSSGLVYLFGGTDADDEPTGTLWRFDTEVAPGGAYSTLTAGTGLARAGADSAPLGNEQFVVTGDPPVLVDGISGRANELAGAPALIDTTAETVLVGGLPNTLFAGAGIGDTGALLLANDTFTPLEAPAAIARTGHAQVVLAGGDMLVVGGSIEGAPVTSAVRYAPGTGDFTVVDELLTTPRTGAAIAASRRYLVVAGGLDDTGAPVGTAEIFDAATLDPVAEVPMQVPRTGAIARPLANGQVLIAGGLDVDGNPVAALELFTGAP